MVLVGNAMSLNHIVMYGHWGQKVEVGQIRVSNAAWIVANSALVPVLYIIIFDKGSSMCR